MFERHYLSLSGSMQTTLMRMTEKAKDIGWRTLFLALYPAPLQPIVAYCTVCNKAGKSLQNETTFSLSFSPYTNQTVTPAMEMKKYTSLVMKLIESAVATLEKGKYIFICHTFYSMQYFCIILGIFELP